MSRSHQYSNYPSVNAQRVVSRQVVEHFVKDGERMNHLVERTGECLLLTTSYMAYRIEVMLDGIDKNSPFVMRLRNRATTILRACDDFIKVMEPMIKPGDDYKKAYGFFSDVIQNALDSLFDDLHRDYPEAQLQVVRRAKLRYHDPYPTAIKECTAAFEDGYVKGYTDAMDDFMREVANLADNTDTMLSVTIGDDGKINIRKP
jgi:hypothetical protein